MFDVSSFPRHCGSVIFSSLELGVNATDLKYYVFPKSSYLTAFAIYTDTAERKKTYKKLRKLYKILYQSPVLVNPSTGNEYFIVIYLNENP